MKLTIQIPCFNEESSLPVALAELPREVEGFDSVEWLIIDDGSTDATVDVARRHGVDHIVKLPHNMGLAAAFSAGLEACLRAGADVIINTDADNQYCAADIPALVRPILDRRADMVIGARPISQVEHFSPIKKLLQRIGTNVVRNLSGVSVDDAPSGFRAFTRDAALKLAVLSRYTYTMDTLIQAKPKGIRVVSTPVRVNPDLRPSRLVKSSYSYVLRSAKTILEMCLVYRPFEFFTTLAAVPLAAGIVLMARWLYLNIFRFAETGRLHIPSLVVAVFFVIVGIQLVLFGLSGRVTATNRQLLEDIRYRMRKHELDGQASPFLKTAI